VGDDEVVIAVHAAGLNFRDAMVAASALPPESVSGGLFADGIGLECAGTIVSAGKNAAHLRPQTKVMAIAPRSVAGLVRTKADFVYPIPPDMEMTRAAALPMAMLTAWHALSVLAELQPGQRVLIHAAAGGVGHAAVHIALARGAAVYATTSVAKQPAVQAMGVAAVYDSRSTDWFGSLMRDTDDTGVDVVLNSLSGEHLPLGLRALAPGGRFVEIGKSDLYSRRRIALRHLADNQAFFALDIDRLLVRQPAQMRRSLDAAFAFASEHGWPAMPVHVRPMSDVVAGLTRLSRGEVVGKEVLETVGTLPVLPARTFAASPDEVWLVAGGTKGFGLAVADFLVQRGVRHLVLVSRSGLPEAEAERIAALRNGGAQVRIEALDVADAAAVSSLIAQIHTPATPLAGVIQSTLQLADGMLDQMTRQQMIVPMISKVAGTWNLHCATAHIPLRAFVSFSSISSMYGFPGQGNYAAANAFLDAFSAYRRVRGLAAATINWGALGDVGFVSRNRAVADFLSNNGWEPLRLDSALAALEQVLLGADICTGVFNTDWNRVAQAFSQSPASTRFGALHRASRSGDTSRDSQSVDIVSALRAADDSGRTQLLQAMLKTILSRVVGIPEDRLDTALPITRFGLDSLMANQIRSVISARLGVDVSLMQIMQGPSIASLSESLRKTLGETLSQSQPAASTRIEDEPSSRLFPGRIRNARAQVRLFCLPYLGAGASIFSSWQQALGERIEVCPIQLPGREERVDEPPIEDAQRLIGALADAVLPLTDMPFALYGHSYGGNLAFSLASWLEGRHGRSARRVFIAAASPPGISNPLEEEFRIADAKQALALSEAEMRALLQRIGADRRLLEDPDLLRALLPALRADLAITRQRLFPAGHVISAPIDAIGGRGDHLYDRTVIAAWGRHTRDFTAHEIDGGHLFVHEPDALQAVFALIGRILR
jgi:surfactin synthase thioesterase subunit/NADPH:quinone reductase-like Zn-dependent oxidoreductase/NADP-dependent 3-hydroxy acid dehydrogenase YdfG